MRTTTTTAALVWLPDREGVEYSMTLRIATMPINKLEIYLLQIRGKIDR